MKSIKILLLVAMTALMTNVKAQQQAMFSQYMFNTLAINPAYAGSQETVSLTALTREQWVGQEGAPSTQTFSAHTPFEKKRIGVGLVFLHDKIGVTHQTGVYGSYAYKIPLSKGQLSLGIQGGFTHYNANFSQVSLTDPTFQNGDVVEFHPNFGAGIYYNTDRFYMGASVPQLIQSKFDKNNQASYAKILRHFFIQSGYVFDLNYNFKLKPNVLVKMVDGAPIEFDLNANLYMYDRLALGLSWRSMDAIVMILQVQITNKLQFGYSYDFGTTALRVVNSGSHEFMLNYRIPLSKSRIITPRYF